MIPPSFSDLGKTAKDLFEKKFKFGIFNVECITKNESTTLTVNATHDNKSKNLSGHLEAKHSIEHGFLISNKWSTANVLTTKVSKDYKSIRGLKNTGILTFEPDTGKKSFKSENAYKRDYLNFNSDIVFNSCKPVVNANFVLGCTHPRGYIAGADLSFDTNDKVLKHHTFALGYEKQDIGVVTFIKNLSIFNTWIHQKINKHTDVGVHISYDKNEKLVKYGIAGQYNIPDSDNSFIKAKVDQDTSIGLAYGCNLNDGMQLTLSVSIDGKKLDTGPHMFGLGLVYEP